MSTPPGRERPRRLVGLAAVAIVTLLLLEVTRRLDPARVLVAMRAADARWLMAGIACYVASIPLWAAQWLILAPRVPRNRFANMLAVVALSATASSTGVLIAGEASAVGLLIARVGLEPAAALSVLTMDQLLVGLSKLAVIAAAATTLTLPPWLRHGALWLGGAVLALVIGALGLAVEHRAIARRVDLHLPNVVGRTLSGVGQSLEALRSRTRATGGLALALAKKLCEALAIVCVQRALAVDLPLGSAFLVLGALGVTTMVSIVPGNLGIFEATIVLVYTQLGVPQEQAISMALVQHGCYLASFALPGYWFLARRSPHGVVDARDQPERLKRG